MNKLLLVTLLLAFILSACSRTNDLAATVKPIETKGMATIANDATATVKPTETKGMATIANDDGAKTSQILVEKWMSAYLKHDANLLLSLWSDNISWKICRARCSEYGMDALKIYVPRDLSGSSFQVNFLSYTVLNKGIFAVVQSIYQDPAADAKDPTPATIILEIDKGKISNETWYYIATP